MTEREREVRAILARTGAVIADSHIVYKSGNHGSVYINKDAIYPHTADTSRLCGAIAARLLDYDVEVVVAPAIGGVILSQWTAYHLSWMTEREVLGVYAEKDANDNFVIKRGYDKLVAGKRIAVVEDVLTTGGSARQVVKVVRALCGEVVGVGALCNRGGVTAKDLANVPVLHALIEMRLDQWPAENCPLCKGGVPINTDVGHGAQWLAGR